MVRYIVRSIDGRYAVQKEHSGIDSMCDSQAEAIALARKLLSEAGLKGEEHIDQLQSGTFALWRAEEIRPIIESPPTEDPA